MTSERNDFEALASQYGIHRQDGHPSTWEFNHEGLLLFVQRLQRGNAEAAYKLIQEVRNHCIRVEGMWPDLDTHARLQQMHVELQDRVRSTVATACGGKGRKA